MKLVILKIPYKKKNNAFSLPSHVLDYKLLPLEMSLILQTEFSLSKRRVISDFLNNPSGFLILSYFRFGTFFPFPFSVMNLKFEISSQEGSSWQE